MLDFFRNLLQVSAGCTEPGGALSLPTPDIYSSGNRLHILWCHAGL